MMVCEDVYAPGAIRSSDMAQVDGLGIRQAKNRRGAKSHPDWEALGEMLELGIACDHRRGISGRDPRGEAPFRDEVTLELRRVHLVHIHIG